MAEETQFKDFLRAKERGELKVRIVHALSANRSSWRARTYIHISLWTWSSAAHSNQRICTARDVDLYSCVYVCASICEYMCVSMNSCIRNRLISSHDEHPRRSRASSWYRPRATSMFISVTYYRYATGWRHMQYIADNLLCYISCSSTHCTCVIRQWPMNRKC